MGAEKGNLLFFPRKTREHSEENIGSKNSLKEDEPIGFVNDLSCGCSSKVSFNKGCPTTENSKENHQWKGEFYRPNYGKKVLKEVSEIIFLRDCSGSFHGDGKVLSRNPLASISFVHAVGNRNYLR